MKIKRAIILFLIISFSMQVFAQERKITGTIISQNGKSLSKVKVSAINSEVFTFSDKNGDYLISVPESDNELEFFLKGMQTVKASIGDQTVIDIEMFNLVDVEIYNLSLEDLMNMDIITASKKAEKASDAPGIITTITKEEIKYFGANNVGDVLERATSIQRVGSHLFPNNVSAMRGDLRTHYDNHTLVLINGRPIRDGVQGGVNSPIYLGLPVDIIEKIEIIRGPGSVLYGSNAFTSVINIITRNDNDKNSIGAKVTAGSFGTLGGSVTGTYAKDDFKANVSAKIDDIQGWDYSAMTVHPAPTNPNLPVDMKYGRKNTGLAADVSYKGLSLSGFYTNDNQDVLGILPYATWAGNNKLSRLFLNLGYDHKFSDTWGASMNASYSGADYMIGDDAETPVDHQESTDYLAELTVIGQLFKNMNLVVGGVVDSRNKNNIGIRDAIPVTYNQLHLSGYIQADYRPVDMLKLIAGAQLNKPDFGEVDVVPRLGAIANFTDNFGIKTLYASAFRSPWPIEQMLQNPVLVGNPNLTPEKISTLDIQLFYASKKAEASITYYNSAFSNSITRAPLSDGSGASTFVNQGELHMNGIEMEGKVSISSNLFITGSATIQNNADEETVPVYIPNFMGKIGAFYKTNFGLTAGVYNTYYGKPKENNGALVNPAASAIDLLSVNLNYELPISVPVELSVYAKNILNSSPYFHTEFARGWANTLPMFPGAEIYGKVSVRF